MLSLKGVENEGYGNIAKSLSLQKHFCRDIFRMAMYFYMQANQ